LRSPLTRNSPFGLGASADPVGVFLDRVLQLAAFGGINLDETVGAAQSDPGLVRADVGGEAMSYSLREARRSPRFDVPKDDPAGFGPGRRRREQLAGAREFPRPRLAFVERKDAEQL
jgi:hypothetical protein